MPTSSSGCSPAPARPATSSISTAACSAAMTASSTTPSASGGASASPPAEPLYVVAPRCGERAGRRRPARGAGDAPSAPARRQLAGSEAPAPSTTPSRATSSSRCARPGRRPRLASSSGGEAGTVELAVGEEGVAPGQACVFYDGEGAGAACSAAAIIAEARASREAAPPDSRRSAEAAFRAPSR